MAAQASIVEAGGGALFIAPGFEQLQDLPRYTRPQVLINSGGAALSGSGASPTEPKDPA